MPDHIRYDLLTQQALRSVVRDVLAEAAKKGLPGDHHFYISFGTHADGVRISDRLRAQYPEEMTIILQHQFWDLTVTDTGFEVGLSFGGIPEKLLVPFEAITGFFDPSVQFGLQFEELGEGEEAAQGAPGAVTDKTGKRPRLAPTPAPAAPPAAATPPVPPAPVPEKEPAANAPEPPPDKPSGGGEVVRLDRFRKK